MYLMISVNTHILIALAWPYANGPLHLGHLAALISGDVIARYFRQRGNPVLMVSGSDCHGTPIALAAEDEKIHPRDLAERVHLQHKAELLDGLKFSYDLFTTTMTENHARVVQEIFLALYEKKLIVLKKEEQPYCSVCEKFLPDRYVEGICPFCDFSAARGDQCDNCGKLIEARQLKSPRCKLCNATPVWRETEHFFLRLNLLQDKLSKWIENQKHWRPNAYNFSLNYLKEGLHDRAITRDITWGIPIPLAGYEGKRIYVWFEAVIGYLSASREWAETQGRGELWRDFWHKEACHYYVHGKDNIPFHTIIFPAILMGYDETLHLPDQIISSEYLNMEGQQFSKSRGVGVWLQDMLKQYPGDVIRFYSLYNLPEQKDTDFSTQDFEEKNNGELVGNFGNFVNRVLTFTFKHFEGRVPARAESFDADDAAMLKLCQTSFDTVARLLEKGEVKQALKEIFALLHEANRYIDKKSPWKHVQQDAFKAGHVLNICLQIIHALRVLLAPFLPTTAERLSLMLRSTSLEWKYTELAAGTVLGVIEMLFKKLEDDAPVTAHKIE